MKIIFTLLRLRSLVSTVLTITLPPLSFVLTDHWSEWNRAMWKGGIRLIASSIFSTVKSVITLRRRKGKRLYRDFNRRHLASPQVTHTHIVCVCVSNLRPCVCACCLMLNGVVFPHEGVVKMAAFSQHVVTVPEGRNRLIQRSKYRQLLSVGFSVCLCVLSCTLNVNVGSVGFGYLHVYVQEWVSDLWLFCPNFQAVTPIQSGGLLLPWWSSTGSKEMMLRQRDCIRPLSTCPAVCRTQS